MSSYGVKLNRDQIRSIVIALLRKQQEEDPSPPTLSIAVAASVIDNTQSAEQATAVAGQIARTAAIFNVDEVVVIDDSDSSG